METHLPDGSPKGIKLVLKERNLWPLTKLDRICAVCKKCSSIQDSCCAVRILELQPDFVNQKSLIEETIESHGHKVIFYPKFPVNLILLNYFGVQQNNIPVKTVIIPLSH